MKRTKRIMALLLAAAMSVGSTPMVALAETHNVDVTVTYNANGGTGANMADDTVTVPANSDYTLFELDANQYDAPANKVFLGWGESADATQTVDRIVVKDTDSIKNVYAIWGYNRASSGDNQSLSATNGSIIVNNGVDGETYTAYQLFQLFSWTDTDTAADEHQSEAYSYYIDTAHPLYTFLQNYKYDDTNLAFTFDTAHNNTTIDSEKTLTPVKAVDGFLGLTGTPQNFNDENIEAEYQVANAKFQDFARAVMTQISGLSVDAKNSIKKGEAVASNNVATIGSLPLGYYLVDSTLGSLCVLDTTNANVTIVDKNEVTTVTKQVKEDGGSEQSDGYGDKNDADLGQEVEYKTTVTIPPRQSNVIFHDTMSAGLTLVPNSISVSGTNVESHFTIYDNLGSDTTNANLPSDSKYYGDTFAVMFDNAWTESLTESVTVTITYKAVLNSNAIVGEQSGLSMGNGNDNQCHVTFGNAQTTESDWTRTYTWDFDLFKYTGTSQSQTALPGAKFTVAKSSAANTNLEFVLTKTGDANNPSIYRLAVSGDTAKVTELVTPASGKINIQGLDADTYTLTETVAPTGYNKLAGTISYTIDSNTDTAQGNDNTKQGDVAVAYSHTFDNATAATKQVDVLNQSGTELPSTGGIGTTIFYVVGGLLLAGSVVALVAKRRLAAEE